MENLKLRICWYRIKSELQVISFWYIFSQFIATNNVYIQKDRVETKDEDRLLDFQIEHDLVRHIYIFQCVFLFVFTIQWKKITLGWVHTHPTQQCFMSSVDMHTQAAYGLRSNWWIFNIGSMLKNEIDINMCRYQLMLPEAVAIVLAPKERSSGTFSLSTFGLATIRKCKLTGFHPHNEHGLYGVAQHVTWRKVPSYVIVDFRWSSTTKIKPNKIEKKKALSSKTSADR